MKINPNTKKKTFWELSGDGAVVFDSGSLMPELYLPTQWAAHHGGKARRFEAEHRLLVWVLGLAIWDFWYYHRKQGWDRKSCDAARFNYLDARYWLLSNTIAPWGYRWVCDELGIDAQRIRQAVLARRTPAPRKLAAWLGDLMGAGQPIATNERRQSRG